jgi:hypothetical protein
VPKAQGCQGEDNGDEGDQINPERAQPGPEKSERAQKMFRFVGHISDSDGVGARDV